MDHDDHDYTADDAADLHQLREELRAAREPAPRSLRARVVTWLIVSFGVIGLIVGAVGFTVGYQQTKETADAGLSLAQQIDALCASSEPENVASQRLCDDAQDVIQGDPGPVGGQGPIGPQGPEGAQGPQGSTGGQGPGGGQGPIGPQGPQGPKGDQGNEGIGTPGTPGTSGNDGQVGGQGPKGEQGDKGDKGEPGEKGNPGDKGEPGESAYPFSFSWTVTDLMGEHVYTATCSAPGACVVSES